MTHPYFDGCKCYVRHLTEEVVFGLHYGAHNPRCPVYRVSLDPVDRAHDEGFRAQAEIATPTTHAT